MFKLLTDNARLKAKREYSLRRLIVGLGGVCIIMIIGVVAVLPSYIISKSRMNEALIRMEALKNSPSTQDAHSLVEWLDDLNLKLSTLFQLDKSVSAHEFFLNIINAKPAGISIRSFMWKKDTKTLTVSVSGNASDRNALLDFENRLNNSGNFANVSLPISNFAKDKDINFELSLTPQK